MRGTTSNSVIIKYLIEIFSDSNIIMDWSFILLEPYTNSSRSCSCGINQPRNMVRYDIRVTTASKKYGPIKSVADIVVQIMTHGCSSVWAFLIYGVSGLMQEYMHYWMSHKVPFLIRGFIYVTWMYLWEYATGSLLNTFHACPWNYKQFHHNVHGLITFEYAPLWYIESLLLEVCVIRMLPYFIMIEDDQTF